MTASLISLTAGNHVVPVADESEFDSSWKNKAIAQKVYEAFEEVPFEFLRVKAKLVVDDRHFTIPFTVYLDKSSEDDFWRLEADLSEQFPGNSEAIKKAIAPEVVKIPAILTAYAKEERLIYN